jgi:hypothetical protein
MQLRLTHRASRAVGAFFVLVLSACGSSTGPQVELTAARQRWSERGPASYVMTVARGCECAPGAGGPVVVTVRGNAVESRRYAPSGAAVPAQFEALFPTVDGLFALIEQAHRDKVYELLVEYHTTLGYPLRVTINPHKDHVDDEVIYQVTDLHD